MKKKYYRYMLSFGHFCSDINQSALSALLPFVIASYHYDYKTAATLVMASNIVGSFVQPVIGHLADKKNQPWVMALGLLMAGGGIAMTGVMSSFVGLMISVMVSGIGIAMFHPQGARLLNKASEGDVATSLSVFAFGGSMGNTFGPIILSAAIGAFGMKGTLVFFIPEFIVCAMIMRLYGNLSELGRTESSAKEAVKSENHENNWSGFIRLALVMIGWSMISHGMSTFLSLHLINDLGQSQGFSSLMLSVYFGVAAFCTLMGGRLAEKFGYRRVIHIGFTCLIPLLLLFSQVKNIYLAIVVMICIGICVQITYSPMVAIGQKYLPDHVGFASGITLGVAVSAGGIFARVLGSVADARGLVYILMLLGGIAVIPAVISYFLPEAK